MVPALTAKAPRILIKGFPPETVEVRVEVAVKVAAKVISKIYDRRG
jgi:hypothetical protein